MSTDDMKSAPTYVASKPIAGSIASMSDAELVNAKDQSNIDLTGGAANRHAPNHNRSLLREGDKVYHKAQKKAFVYLRASNQGTCVVVNDVGKEYTCSRESLVKVS